MGDALVLTKTCDEHLVVLDKVFTALEAPVLKLILKNTTLYKQRRILRTWTVD